MIWNYFITAFRIIIRNKIQSVIQVASLAIGITAILLIGLYVNHELSYDKFNEKLDRIFRLEYGDAPGLPTAPGHLIKENISEVENVVRMVNWAGRESFMIVDLKNGDESTNKKYIKIPDFFLCDSTIFEIFTFPLIQGDPKSALKLPFSVVLSESASKKIFVNQDPVGKILEFWGYPFTITGIMKDVKNSHIEVNMLISIVSINRMDDWLKLNPEWLNSYWPDFSYFTYLILPENRSKKFIENRINEYFTEHSQSDTYFFSEGSSFGLRPLKDIYFSRVMLNEMDYCRHGNAKLLRLLMTISVFILLLAIINYINLTTARASLRAKEVGIRKVAGSSKAALINQFLSEAVLVAFLSLLIALTMVQLLLPGFNQLALTDLDLETIMKPGTWTILLIFVILTGVVSGIYPALSLTQFQPVNSLTGGHLKGSKSAIYRRVLLTLQFSISIILIVGVLVIIKQLNYMKNADLGFDEELVVNLGNYGWQRDPSKRELFKEKLLKNPSIRKVAFSEQVMGGSKQAITQAIEIEGIKKQVEYLLIDPDFFDLMEIKLIHGRNFSWDFGGDSFLAEQGRRIIINETAMREFGLESPIGSIVKFEGFDRQDEIIGVVEDFHFESLHNKIKPCVYFWENVLNKASIKISPDNIPATIGYIKNEVLSIAPEALFEYSFLDESFEQQYQNDERLAKIITNFAIVAILIGCLGLFGLSSFMAARRTKEIGIRKAMGASVRSVFLLLSREFVKWVVVSVIIACPLAWIIMNRWLQSFAYKTNIGAGIFVLSIVIAFVIAFLTIAWKSFKTARTNPVEALRYE
jgi:putative ABC transport system permease protein